MASYKHTSHASSKNSTRPKHSMQPERVKHQIHVQIICLTVFSLFGVCIVYLFINFIFRAEITHVRNFCNISTCAYRSLRLWLFIRQSVRMLTNVYTHVCTCNRTKCLWLSVVIFALHYYARVAHFVEVFSRKAFSSWIH